MDYIRRSGGTNTQSDPPAAAFPRRAGEGRDRRDRGRPRRSERSTKSPDSNSARNRLEKAQTDLETTTLRTRGLRAAYLQQAQNTTSGIPVRVLNQADAAASDSGQKLRLIITVALAAGIALGVALATAVAARRWRRELPRL